MPDCFASHHGGGGPGAGRAKLASPDPVDPKPKPLEATWITKCLNVPESWKIPAGHTYYEYFGKGMEGNRSGFPSLQHHKKNKPARMCLVYYSTGECKRGLSCAMAHLPIAEMREADRKLAGDRFQTVYARGKAPNK